MDKIRIVNYDTGEVWEGKHADVNDLRECVSDSLDNFGSSIEEIVVYGMDEEEFFKGILYPTWEE